MYSSYDPFDKRNQETTAQRMNIRFIKVDEFLCDNDDEEVYRDIIMLLQKFSGKCPDYITKIISEISQLVTISMQTKNKIIRDKEKGIEGIAWMIESKKDWNFKNYVVFGHEFMKAYFPNATSDQCLDYMKKYYDEYVQALKNCKTEIIDSHWAVEIVEMNDYFKKLLENNEN